MVDIATIAHITTKLLPLGEFGTPAILPVDTQQFLMAVRMHAPALRSLVRDLRGDDQNEALKKVARTIAESYASQARAQ